MSCKNIPTISFLLVGAVIVCSLILEISSAENDGKYRASKYGGNGKYRSGGEGKYVPMYWPYMHIHDNRELGRYMHIHIPYLGGYGPYDGDIDQYRYAFDPTGDYSQEKYTVSRPGLDNDPFNAQAYEIPTPQILLEYGFPDHDPTPTLKTKRSIVANANQQSVLVNAKPPQYSNGLLAKTVIDSQTVKPGPTTTTTTTTPRPRTQYDDEGKWKIIRQEQAKTPKKYDYLYLTENGIYHEEQAKLVNQQEVADGTNSQGFYQYTGDDGKLYKVEYTVGEQGFVPMGEHIPTPPPIPDSIRKALEYVAARNLEASH